MDATHEAMKQQAEQAWKKTRARWRHRGSCPVCGFRHNLLKDRVTLSQHKVYSGNEGRICEGSGKPEKFAAENAAARAAHRRDKNQ